MPAEQNHQANPFDSGVAEQISRLNASSSAVRAGAAEALGYLRAYAAATPLARALQDPSHLVRREAAMSLAWCGGRREVPSLLAAMDDQDWVVRQAACVSLGNITGMNWPFEGMAQTDIRTKQVAQWRTWWAQVPNREVPSEVIELLDRADPLDRLRAVRALGALGGDGAADRIIGMLRHYDAREYRAMSAEEKHVVQSCLRGLGRLREANGQDVLLEFLDSVQWTRYAADALGDFGDRRAVAKLIELYPKFARNLTNRRIRTNEPVLCPRDDRFDGDNTQDRMHETPFAIASALVRLPLDDPKHIAGLRRIAPYLVANLPSDWDGGVLYEQEAFQLVTTFLLEKAGVRDAACEAAFQATAQSDQWLTQKPDRFAGENATTSQAFRILAIRQYGDVPYVGQWFPALCRHDKYVPRLIGLLDHDNGWIRINVAKTLMLMNARQAISPMAKILREASADAEYGYSGVLEHAEYNSPAPRWREAYIRGLGRLQAKQHDALLIQLMEDPKNVVDIQHAAALALDELGTSEAVAALMRADADHPFHSVRMVAREALWRRGLLASNGVPPGPKPINDSRPAALDDHTPSDPTAIVFIKGDNDIGSDFNGQAGVDPWRQTYSITNSGPAYRRGRNLYILRRTESGRVVTPLTRFDDGFVADCEVSWDGDRVIFARRANGDDRNYRDVPYRAPTLKASKRTASDTDQDPWWHIWEIRADGSGLRQITHGPYHDVGPAYLPDGRIVFTTSRIGLRDEYHGYPCTGLATMNSDGSDIQPIGFNLGGDREPAVMEDGRIVFSRLDNFYSRLKTEMTLQTTFSDGTKNVAFYGPERRPFWRTVNVQNAAWTLRPSYGDDPDNRNRVLRLTQPQPMGDGRVVCVSSGGLALVGPERHRETMIPHDRKMAVTSPFPLDDGRHILCAATIKQFRIDGQLVTAGTEQFRRLEKGPELFRSAVNIDLALYMMDSETGKMDMLYNDPDAADFEPRPIMPRRRPRTLSEVSAVRRGSYTARLFCNSARVSRQSRIGQRGKLIRVIEGLPVVARHETQTNRPTNRWKNHGGTHARVLGTAPLAADGSFFVEVPADRLLHLQVLDSDRRVVGNQIFWMYARPGETRSCVGCHENPNSTAAFQGRPPASTRQPIPMLPTGGEFTYRAKAWLKGSLPDEAEERNRTVRAVSLMGRY